MNPGSPRLSGHVAIVTGTSPNIGGAIAEELAAEGAAVACVDRDPSRALRAAEAIRRDGGRALGIPCDVTEEDAVERAVEEATATLGPVDFLVNNAALFDMRGVLDMPADAWRRQLSVLLDGAFLFTRAVARRLVSRGKPGAIVNIVSTAGHQGQPGNIGYCTAKAGLLNFTRSAAMELARYGIRVNSLTPTATDPAESLERAARWGVAPSGHPAELFESFRRRIPGQRLPRPRDYARAVVYLLSADAERITGTDLRVDAGALARYWAWEPEDPGRGGIRSP